MHVPKVDFLTNQERWKNGMFGLVFSFGFRKSDYRKSRTDGEKTGCQENVCKSSSYLKT
jgi:hypothetical protein